MKSDPKAHGPNEASGAWPGTPFFLKRDEDFDWPEEPRMFYLLTSSGLLKCRNHEFFRSCAESNSGPSDLADQESFVECSFPRIPTETLARVVGFFERIRQLHNSEASVLLAFDREHQSVELVVPEQTATVIRYHDGYQHPIGLLYTPPTDLPPNWVVFGDIHSHVDLAAYSSATDVADEVHSAGLHIVVGRLYQNPPEVHVEAVVDGTRFDLELAEVLEAGDGSGQEGGLTPGGILHWAKECPAEWVARVKVDAGPTTYSKASGVVPATGYAGDWSSSGWSNAKGSAGGKR